jgi:hypothetical protein
MSEVTQMPHWQNRAHFFAAAAEAKEKEEKKQP